ncbi:YwiC-like family protein [Thermostaphylospora chromogena]|uniref:YwiC-like protein n=1 Tax=Thermostaphylospora chromogena TaxID=35622 RepID=A0A1H1CRS9_9ACTN|nr:YwiC-like family protein [Thermostaphylospora chromogena]SDQ67017.1 YwiC-like protein [Thermostaphylospora chromogena]
MDDAGAAAGTAKRPAAKRWRRFVPPQHGAWAMLAVPYLAGLLAAGYRWPDLPLLGAWLAGYLLSYYVFQSLKSRRPRRYRDQLLVYGGVAAPLLILVVVACPPTLWYAPAYAVLFAINAWYAWRRRERALINDLVSVAQSCLMVFVVATIAETPPAEVLAVFALCAAYFVGTVPYVKTMIRERENPVYLRWSIAYHVAAVALAACLSLWTGVLFAWFLLRAALFPNRGLTPKQVGLIETANSVLLLACVPVI